MAELDRFRDAQDSSYEGYESALDEVRSGGKSGHWIWYVFPRISGLGTSGASQTYAIQGEAEALEFLRDPELRSRYLTNAQAVAAQLKARKPLRVLMGSDIDAKKIVSSLTLFGYVSNKIHDIEGTDACRFVATVADEVLTMAAAQGYQPCAYTLRRIREST